MKISKERFGELYKMMKYVTKRDSSVKYKSDPYMWTGWIYSIELNGVTCRLIQPNTSHPNTEFHYEEFNT